MSRPIPFIIILCCSIIAAQDIRAQTPFDTARSLFHPDSLSVAAPIQNGVWLGFDHVLSIYEWRGRVLYTSNDLSSVQPRALQLPIANSIDQRRDTVIFDANSRFLADNTITTTSVNGYISAEQ